jgi:putative copper export protein
MSLYHVNVTIHLLAALLWLGGIFFLAVVGAPVLRRVEPPELRAALFRELGARFRSVGWACIVVLLVTGVLNLHFRGVLTLATLASPDFWSTRYGTALAWKLAAVAGMLALQAVHDFVTGPAASRLQPGSPAMLKARRRAALLARGSALLGIVVVLAAVRLARGG